ncbi:MAG: isoprenylcysteine carboxylmethyltransferase family protein [Proteobacteria bacterium]|nr:isoprenylcysteine carboxylmethyltransferase family protein [Pseudomonadota bacterium]MBU1737432.1 isoprenylcysteine carboxylmethyltransferase family protein [Pseudomonadota bacterium]
MDRTIIFVLCTLFFVVFSWRSLHNPKHHGFYRFFVFEGTLILVLMNYPFWFTSPFSPLQLLSWTFLFTSILFVLQGFLVLRKSGGSGHRKANSENLRFENTVNLVADGLYKHIRHPMYSSLLLLAWGAFLKNITIPGFLAVTITTAFLLATAKTEERENISFFGSRYQKYIKQTKMFLPYLL